MEFVGDKTPCLCGSSKCSGLIGEKFKEPEKKNKKNSKKKTSTKVTLPRSEKQRVTNDPFVAMLNNMAGGSESA